MAENVEDLPEYQAALKTFRFRYGIPNKRLDLTDRVLLGAFKEGFVAGWNADVEDA